MAFIQPTEDRVSGKKISEIVKNTQNVKNSIEEVDEINSRIENYILKNLGRPKNYLKMEIKSVGVNKYRVNIICQEYKAEAMMPISSRPYSYYVIADKQKLTFNPSL